MPKDEGRRSSRRRNRSRRGDLFLEGWTIAQITTGNLTICCFSNHLQGRRPTMTKLQKESRKAPQNVKGEARGRWHRGLIARWLGERGGRVPRRLHYGLYMLTI